MTDLADALPAELRDATLTRIPAGLSGAEVYRVDGSAGTFVLKRNQGASPADWRRAVEIHRLAADAGIAPRIVHVDESHAAVLTELVEGQSFPAFYMTPQTTGAATELLATTIRRLHDIPAPTGTPMVDPRAVLQSTWSDVPKAFPIPPFAADTIRSAMEAEVPDAGRAPVLSHNDVNPSNLMFDGTRLMLLDWNTAAVNSAYYDLASIALFLRMDRDRVITLLSAYEGRPVTGVPARFDYDRRLVGSLVGLMFMLLAGRAGHWGGRETLDEAPTLVDVYQRMRTGALNLATPDGLWAFGLALTKSVAA